MVVMPSSTASLWVRKVRKRTQNQRSRGQGIGNAHVATTTSPGGKRAISAIRRSLSAKLSRTVGRKSLIGSKRTELEGEVEVKEEEEHLRRI